jgi:hypothetical protein
MAIRRAAGGAARPEDRLADQAVYQRQSKIEAVVAVHAKVTTMSGTPPREEIDAKLALVESRGDTKFAQVLGEMRTGFAAIDGKFVALNTRLDGLERSASGTKATIILTGIGAVAIVIGVLAYGQTWFGIGVATRDTVKSAVSEYIQQTTPPKK